MDPSRSRSECTSARTKRRWSRSRCSSTRFGDFATRPVEVVPMLELAGADAEGPGQSAADWVFVRAVSHPSLAGYRGRGIYSTPTCSSSATSPTCGTPPWTRAKCSAPAQDNPPVTWQNNAHFQPGRQMSVMLIDCEKCDWKIDDIVRGLDEGRYDYRNLMCDLCVSEARRDRRQPRPNVELPGALRSRADEAAALHRHGHAAMAASAQPAEIDLAVVLSGGRRSRRRRSCPRGKGNRERLAVARLGRRSAIRGRRGWRPNRQRRAHSPAHPRSANARWSSKPRPCEPSSASPGSKPKSCGPNATSSFSASAKSEPKWDRMKEYAAGLESKVRSIRGLTEQIEGTAERK